MEKEWTKYERNTVIYKQGARKFVDNVQTSMGNPERIRCPCNNCISFKRHNFNVVYDHLICYGIDHLYSKWTWHGDEPTLPDENNVEMPETYRMFQDALFEDNDAFSEENDVREPGDEREEPDFGYLLEEAERPIYKGSTLSKMSATVAMCKFKARHGLSNIGFDDMVEMIRGFLPHDNTLPSPLYNAKKLLNAFDLGYEKIHACVRDCCLFRKELEHADKCPKCGSSCWKVDKRTQKIQEGVPAKVLRYFPIIPRFRRMFKSVEKAEQLRWHHTHKSQDGIMHHLVDSLAWKSIDSNWPSFASDPRNLRLGLSSDVLSTIHVYYN
ncbi:uncharacterized protein LOC112177003 [Rosa chinensis]|uniref:uncharacterized protein LOC112177003 n=1 Tax=Rosa chinensis TaxID=74649 RepID=UPI000D08E7ED|nr:uncharacterized protein LOC112177003 [Rosa chinensis]XP_024170918.1 uncharacterized protein LOC112177003 [Rosa chinensis]XP_024170920.1 uncharacterized protein LOC112177003 [Rosa chinensis]XP_040366473.1 uncharacterized protein LOC112177003 [Rosa chinensis]